VAGYKSTARDLGAFICFEDEAGQGLRPPKGRTWAPRGACPVVTVRGAGGGWVSIAEVACFRPGDRPHLFVKLRVHCRREGSRRVHLPLRAGCYRSGSADAARSRASDPATTRAEPTAILGLRRCTARAARGTENTTFEVSSAIAPTVSRRGWRRPYRTRRTIPTTGKATFYQAVSDRWRAVIVCARTVAGTSMPRLRIRSFCCSMYCCASARVGTSVPRPHATSPKPAALTHAARARCLRPAAQCPAPTAAWATTGATADTHSGIPEGLVPSRTDIKTTRRSNLIAARTR